MSTPDYTKKWHTTEGIHAFINDPELVAIQAFIYIYLILRRENLTDLLDDKIKQQIADGDPSVVQVLLGLVQQKSMDGIYPFTLTPEKALVYALTQAGIFKVIASQRSGRIWLGKPTSYDSDRELRLFPASAYYGDTSLDHFLLDVVPDTQLETGGFPTQLLSGEWHGKNPKTFFEKCDRFISRADLESQIHTSLFYRFFENANISHMQVGNLWREHQWMPHTKYIYEDGPLFNDEDYREAVPYLSAKERKELSMPQLLEKGQAQLTEVLSYGGDQVRIKLTATCESLEGFITLEDRQVHANLGKSGNFRIEAVVQPIIVPTTKRENLVELTNMTASRIREIGLRVS